MDHNAHEELRLMFPILKHAKVVDETSSASFNDGGSNIYTTWLDGENYFRTEYNNWSVRHPDTRCYAVTPEAKTIVTFTKGSQYTQVGA